MITHVRTAPRTPEVSINSSRVGANARKREATRSARRVEVAREAASRSAVVFRRILGGAFAAVALVGVGYGLRHLALRNGWVDLRQAEVHGYRNVPVSEVMRLSSLRPEPLWGLDLDALRRRLEGHPWIAGASVRRSYPHGLQIELRERVPVLALPDGRWIAEDGRVMDARGSFALTTVGGLREDRKTVSKADLPVVRAIAEMARQAPELLGRLDDVQVERDGSLVVRLTGFAPRVRIAPQDWKRGFARAGALEKELSTESQRIAEIDLRHGACAALRRREGGA